MTAQVAQERAFNFSAGPAALPLSVLQQLQDEMLCLPVAACSLMEMSHRDKKFVEILHAAENGIRELLSVPDDYSVLFLQGGATLQFSMIPMNLMNDASGKAQYLLSGSWGKKAIAEAKKVGELDVAWDGSSSNFDRVPTESDYSVPSDAPYVYYCSNETIQGVQFQSEPTIPENVPLVCDASSDFLSRSLDISKYGMLYACAQKNAGPAGVTVVIMRKDLLERGCDSLPGYLNYRNHAENDSEWNTPPTFAIYALGKVLNWLRDDIGGLAAMEELNRKKSALLYSVVDEYSDFYQGHAQPAARSQMNVTFRLPSDELQSAFISGAADRNLVSLKGHRSVGGIRASVYNAMPMEGAETLAEFMSEFAKANG